MSRWHFWPVEILVGVSIDVADIGTTHLPGPSPKPIFTGCLTTCPLTAGRLGGWMEAGELDVVLVLWLALGRSLLVYLLVLVVVWRVLISLGIYPLVLLGRKPRRWQQWLWLWLGVLGVITYTDGCTDAIGRYGQSVGVQYLETWARPEPKIGTVLDLLLPL